MRRSDALNLNRSKSDLDCSFQSKIVPKMFDPAKNPFGAMLNSLWNEPKHNYQLHKTQKSYFTEHSSSSGQVVQTAGMRVFATVLLNAWRKRKQDVKDLTLKVEELKRASLKTKNQIHVYNTLFRVEQKRNGELTGQLKRSMENINMAKSSCESLTTTIISLKADRALLEEQLRMKLKEFEGLNELLAQTKTDLFRSLVEQRNLQYALCKEQRNVQFLENQKNKLINEISDLGTENCEIQDKYNKELDKKQQELNKATETIKNLEQLLIAKKESAFKLLEYSDTDAKLKKELLQLHQHANSLRNDLKKSMINRIKPYWQRLCNYQSTTIRIGHWFTFYMLPATPPPKFKFTSKMVL